MRHDIFSLISLRKYGGTHEGYREGMEGGTEVWPS